MSSSSTSFEPLGKRLEELIAGQTTVDAEIIRQLLTTHLGAILDKVPASVLASALSQTVSESNTASKENVTTSTPVLNLTAKKRELTRLLSHLDRDRRRAEIVQGRNEREGFMQECLETICGEDWLSDIWRAGFERRSWDEAHEALLWVVEMVDKIGSIAGGCKCVYTSLAHEISITSAHHFTRTADGQLRPRTSVRPIKTFTLQQLSALPNILLWIWREVFMSMFEHGTVAQHAKIGKMLSEVEAVLKWNSLEKLLHGGKRCPDLDDGLGGPEEYGWSDAEFAAGDVECLDCGGDGEDEDDEDDDDDDWEDEDESDTPMPTLESIFKIPGPFSSSLPARLSISDSDSSDSESKPKAKKELMGAKPKLSSSKGKQSQRKDSFSDLPPLEPIISSRTSTPDLPPLEPFSSSAHSWDQPPPLAPIQCSDSSTEDEGTDTYGVFKDDDGNDSDGSEVNSKLNPKCLLHSKHWAPSTMGNCLRLRRAVVDKLFETFNRLPSFDMYDVIVDLAPSAFEDPDYCKASPEDAAESFENVGIKDEMNGSSPIEAKLFRTLRNMAPATPQTFCAALEIYNSCENPNLLFELLSTYDYLVTPASVPIYQQSLEVIVRYLPEKLPWAVERAEEGVLECIHAVSWGLQRRGAFPSIASSPHSAAIQAIIKIKYGTSTRKSKVGEWIDLVSVPLPGSQPSTGGGPAAANPMAFVGMMMGLPPAAFMGGDDDDEEYVGSATSPFDTYGEDEEDDAMGSDEPLIADLRHEFRPRIKEAFQGWVRVMLTFCDHAVLANVKGKSRVADADMLNKVAMLPSKMYLKLVEIMPWFRGADVIDAMIERISDKPSKHHICDVLDSLSTFSKTQRKRIVTKAEKKKKADAAKAIAHAAAPAPASTAPSTPDSVKTSIRIPPRPRTTTNFVNINPFATFSNPPANTSATAGISTPGPLPPSTTNNAPPSTSSITTPSLTSGFSFRVVDGVITSVPSAPGPSAPAASSSAPPPSASASAPSATASSLTEAFRRYLGGMDDVD